MSTTSLFTAAELLELPSGMGKRYELVRGELRVMSPSGWRHGKVVSRLNAKLASFVEQHDLGIVFGAETGFLLASDPTDVETRTPAERVRLLSADQLLEEQKGFALTEAGDLIEQPQAGGWRPTWVIIAHSGLLGDPYFLDIGSPDPEGDCPVFTAMSGTDTWQPRLCASSFAMFLRILAVSMEVAEGFSTDGFHASEAGYAYWAQHLLPFIIGPELAAPKPAGSAPSASSRKSPPARPSRSRRASSGRAGRADR